MPVDGDVVAPGDDGLEGGEKIGVDGVGIDGRITGSDGRRRNLQVDGFWTYLYPRRTKISQLGGAPTYLPQALQLWRLRILLKHFAGSSRRPTYLPYP